MSDKKRTHSKRLSGKIAMKKNLRRLLSDYKAT